MELIYAKLGYYWAEWMKFEIPTVLKMNCVMYFSELVQKQN